MSPILSLKGRTVIVSSANLDGEVLRSFLHSLHGLSLGLIGCKDATPRVLTLWAVVEPVVSLISSRTMRH